METERFFTDMGEDFERAVKGYAPRVTLDGWWWKQYIPYFRHMRRVSQEIVDMEFAQNPERVRDMIEREERREREGFIRSWRNN